jgi:tetratricopeptide (TPR) repeat protein
MGKSQIFKLFLVGIFVVTGIVPQAFAEAEKPAETACPVENRTCVLELLQKSAENISQDSWRDQTYRELAKTLAYEERFDDAIAIVEKIQNPDTKALTIRGIGMAAAEQSVPKPMYDEVFGKLRTISDKIEHPPSYAIALTYIAMAQAFAGDDDGAWKTAGDMENDALRHKAYGETAEIQAEQGHYESAMKSIDFINSEAFRNKAYGTTSQIFADEGLLSDALGAALKITNDYKRASALQYVLDKQKPRELERD